MSSAAGPLPAGRQSTWSACALGVLLVLLAGLVVGEVFAGTGWRLPVVAAAVVPAALAVGIGRLRGPVLGVLAGLGALALLLALGLAPGRAVVSGGRRLLTGALPLEATGGELAAVVVGVGVLSLLAVLVGLTATSRLAVAVPGLLALAAALAVSAAAGPPPRLLLAAVAAAVGALLVRAPTGVGSAGSGRDRLRQTARSTAGTVALLAVGALVAGSVAGRAGAGLPGASLREDRADARDLVDVPVRPRTSTSPLARFAGLAEGAPRTIAVLTGGPVYRLRLATLDRFDGEGWSTAATAVRAGRELPPPPADGLRRTTTRLQVEVADPSVLDFLLTPGRASRITVPGLGVVPATGDLLVPVGRPVPTVYTVTGETPDLRPVSLRGARAGVAPPLPVPADLLDEARERAVGSTSFARLAALEQSLAAGQRAEGEQLPSGSGLFQVAQVLRTGTGTAEQWSSAFAVLAGALGFDTRVVVGFEPSNGDEVLSTDVTAWPEVRFDDIGWLPFTPTPTGTRPTPAGAGSPEDVVREAVQAEQRQAAAPPPLPAPPLAPAPPGVRTPASAPNLPLFASFAFALPLGLLLAVPLLKRARRARRRKGPPGDRVLGAWHEAVDRVAERGLPVTRASTTADVVRGAGVLLPTTAALAELGSLADRVAFSGIGVDESTALRAWTRADEVGAVIRRHASRRWRVMHHFDPRPLLSRGCHWSPPGRRRASGFTDAGPATAQP